MSDFVDLDRRFADVDLGEDREALAEHSYLLGLDGVDQGLSWEALLESRMVVLLGEPGSGKTRELKHQAERRRLAGGRAYFLPLERLVTDDVATVLNGQSEVDDFATWHKGDTSACFFLDAVDESMLQRTGDFLTALERLYGSVKSRLSGCRFVISSRISAWRPATDRDEVLRRFAVPRTTAQEEPAGSPGVAPLRIVTLLPLDRSRVERFARQLGVHDPDKFVEAIDDNEAWDFARRPLDVVDLHKYWNVNGRLDGLTQLLAFSVTTLLTEVENKAEQDRVSPAEAREGAELLAAATVLCRQVSFVIEDGHAINAPAALSPQQVLPSSWLPVKVRSLLDRAIFDSASYGCLRFHHRRHAEYLAATWLERLLAANCPLEALEELLFATIDGQRTLRPSLEPVAAWLVKDAKEPWRQRLALHLLEAAPDIHLRWGDPAALPLSYRRQLLAAIVRRFAGRRLVRLPWSRDALARIATPELADDINRYLRDRNVAEDLKADFLMLVCYGKLSACVPVALELLADHDASDGLKTYAATVVRDVGTGEHRQQAATIYERLEKPSDRLISRLYEALFPQVMSVSDLLASLSGCGEVRRETVDLPNGLQELLEIGLTPCRSMRCRHSRIWRVRSPSFRQSKPTSWS